MVNGNNKSYLRIKEKVGNKAKYKNILFNIIYIIRHYFGVEFFPITSRASRKISAESFESLTARANVNAPTIIESIRIDSLCASCFERQGKGTEHL